MGWTKRAIIQSAYAELGVSTVRGFDLTPEDYQEGNQRLDGLMQRFYQQGYRLGYPSPATFGTGDLDDDSGIPDGANEAVYLSLALRLAPTLGKAVSMETTKAHTAAMMAMARGFSDPIPQRRTNTNPRLALATALGRRTATRFLMLSTMIHFRQTCRAT